MYFGDRDPQTKEDPEAVLSYFIDSVTTRVRATIPNYENLGLGNEADGFVIAEAYPGLVPEDFTGVVATQGEYSVTEAKLMFTGNTASNSGVLTREGMRTLLQNVSARTGQVAETKAGVDKLLQLLGGNTPVSYETRFGFIRGISENGNHRILFDEAEWLTGVEAENAAIAAGQCTQENRQECLPNGYYIKNTTAEQKEIVLDSRANIVMQTWKMEETGSVAARPIQVGEFIFSVIRERSEVYTQVPYRITLANGTVVKIEEVYVP